MVRTDRVYLSEIIYTGSPIVEVTSTEWVFVPIPLSAWDRWHGPTIINDLTLDTLLALV
jgi:hypothetical protein